MKKNIGNIRKFNEILRGIVEDKIGKNNHIELDSNEIQTTLVIRFHEEAVMELLGEVGIKYYGNDIRYGTKDCKIVSSTNNSFLGRFFVYYPLNEYTEDRIGELVERSWRLKGWM